MSTTRSGVPRRAPARTVRAELPERVVVFLRAIGTHAAIRALMAEGGYGRADHEEGWGLLGAVCRFGDSAFDPFADAPAREATREIEHWVATHFPRLHAALDREIGDTRVFDTIESPAAPGAVLALATLLARLRADANAARVLARRGLDRAERRRLAELVRAAQSAPAAGEPTPVRDAREPELTALYRWYTDWAATARAVIARKDFLVTLGLAERERRATASA
jgi:hypothetical protein